MAKLRRWVVKAGSKMVCEGGKPLIQKWMRQAHTLRKNQNIEIIWVTSGAIAWAATKTKIASNNRPRTLPQKQALSSVGQPLVFELYNSALKKINSRGAQVLLTAGDMKDRSRRKNLQNTLNELLSWNILPILNENDAVATAEIQFGDNDSLASEVAIMMGAEKLVLMTDVDGLFSDDPTRNSNADLIRHCPRVGAKELKLAHPKNKSTVGTGGMFSKLLAAQRAEKFGIITHMVRGNLNENLLKIAAGKFIGTQIGGKFNG